MRISIATVLYLLFPCAFGSFNWDPLNVKDKIVKAFQTHLGKDEDFCIDLKCPMYEVSMKGEGYELRCYNATKWVVTEGPVSGGMWMGTKDLFKRLFAYISGENKSKVKIEMTAPVRTKRPLSGLDIGKGKMEMSFWVPPEHQLNPPLPTSGEVLISDEKSRCFYVHSFGGYILFEHQYMNHLKMLIKMLDKDGHTYDKSNFIFSGYNGPMQLLKRHNEVWLEKI